MLRSFGLRLLLASLSLAAFACDGGSGSPNTSTPGSPTATTGASQPADPSPAAPTATPSPTPAPSPTARVFRPEYGYETPPSVRDEGLRAIVDALLSKSPDTILSLVSMSRFPCVSPTGGIPSAPPCLAGTPDGTLTEAFPSGGCEGQFLTKDDLPGLARAIASKPEFLFAVFVSDSDHSLVRIIMEDGVTHLANTFFVRNARLVQVHFGCGEDQIPPAAVVGIGPSQFVIPPPTR